MFRICSTVSFCKYNRSFNFGNQLQTKKNCLSIPKNNHPPDTMSYKQNVGATGLVARSNQEWYNCGEFQLGISIESTYGMSGQ